MGAIDYSLYLVTDRALARGRSSADVVREAVALNRRLGDPTRRTPE